ncbi:hypothetical protein V1477_013678 [Vespula maculifrons]|uniref:Uncharacterized protein n=1 Tax=Vespula maculifrons TaxID=7453 RepID=A0ABD2BNZ1_VESMC
MYWQEAVATLCKSRMRLLSAIEVPGTWPSKQASKQASRKASKQTVEASEQAYASLIPII